MKTSDVLGKSIKRIRQHRLSGELSKEQMQMLRNVILGTYPESKGFVMFIALQKGDRQVLNVVSNVKLPEGFSQIREWMDDVESKMKAGETKTGDLP